ncbi:hypothetical protein GTE46_004994 [Salmonella enterica subsp. enterica]|nr:hypothetical protein [Salmonella enterica subsp. enterica]EDY2803486.1 hypothetical protein [Salmonella enterica subsp. enterica]
MRWAMQQLCHQIVADAFLSQLSENGHLVSEVSGIIQAEEGARDEHGDNAASAHH